MVKVSNIRLIKGLSILSGLLIATAAGLVYSWNPTMTIVPQPSVLSLQYLASHPFEVSIYYDDQYFANQQVQGYNYLYITAGNGQLIYEKYGPVTLTFNSEGEGVLNYGISGSYLYNELRLYPYSPLYINDTLCVIVQGQQLCSKSYTEVPLQTVGQDIVFEFTNPQGVTYTPQYLEMNGLTLNLYATLGTAQEDVIQGELTVYVKTLDGQILYTYQEPVQITSINNQFQVYIPGYVFQNAQGQIDVYATLSGAFTDANVINAQANYTFYIGSQTSPIQVISVSPNFNEMKYVSSQAYTLSALLYNDLPKNINAQLQVYVYDQYGNLVYQNSQSNEISPYQQQILQTTVPFIYMSPGNYKIVVQIYSQPQNSTVSTLIYNQTYYVTLNPQQIYPINVLSVQPTEFNIKPGSYVELILNLENQEPYQVTVQPIVSSQELNLYQQLSSLTLEGNQITQLPVVIYIPNNLYAGYYPITFEFEYNGAYQQYTYNIYVNGTQAPYFPVSASIISYPELVAGENNSVEVLLQSNSTNVYNVIVQLTAENATVYPKELETQIGGYYSEPLKFNVTPVQAGNVTLNVTVINAANGQVMYKTSETLKAESKPSKGFSLPLMDIVYALIVLAIIVVAAVIVYDALKSKKENKEEAEESNKEEKAEE